MLLKTVFFKINGIVFIAQRTADDIEVIKELAGMDLHVVMSRTPTGTTEETEKDMQEDGLGMQDPLLGKILNPKKPLSPVFLNVIKDIMQCPKIVEVSIDKLVDTAITQLHSPKRGLDLYAKEEFDFTFLGLKNLPKN